MSNITDDVPARPDYDPVKNTKITKTISYLDGTEWLYFDPKAKQILKAQSRVRRVFTTHANTSHAQRHSPRALALTTLTRL